MKETPIRMSAGNPPKSEQPKTDVRDFLTAIPDDGWPTHNPGDPMPVAGETLVQLRFANGELSSGFTEASEWEWTPDSTGYAIVAYRLAPPQPATRPPRGDWQLERYNAAARLAKAAQAALLILVAGSGGLFHDPKVDMVGDDLRLALDEYHRTKDAP